jgi:hypothetical protein
MRVSEQLPSAAREPVQVLPLRAVNRRRVFYSLVFKSLFVEAML